MKILIKGAGDLATGIASRLYGAGHQILMTEIAQPLTVRRTVALSRAVYDRRAIVEEMEAVSAKTQEDAEAIMEEGKIPVIVDPKADCRKWYKPDVIVDAIIAKKNTGTKITDAPFVIGIGPGFTAGKDCHCVIETKRGHTLGSVIWEGSAIADTGVPGNIGGYTTERLIRASEDGIIEPKVRIGDIVEKGQIVAYTGGKPVYAGVAGIVRGMLQAGINVKTGLKIGDVDPRKDISLVYKISDKSNLLGMQAYKAAEQYFCSQTGIVVLAAGRSSRYGENKLLAEVGGSPMFRHIFEVLKEFPMCEKVVSTRFPHIMKEAKEQGIAVAENNHPEWGIAYSLQCGLKKCLEQKPDVKKILFVVGDQPYLTAETLRRLMGVSVQYPGKIICAGTHGRPGNPVLWDQKYFQELLKLEGDTGGRQIMKKYPDEVIICETTKKELHDIDQKTDIDLSGQ